MHIALGVVGFGVLGIDPVGAILLAAATATETRRGRVIAFLVAALLTTTVFGVVLAIAGRGFVEAIASRVPSDTSSVWVVVNLIVIGAVVAWLATRFARRNRPAKQKESKRRLLNSPAQYVVAGAVFGVSSITDPTLYAAVALAAESGSLAVMAGASATWFLVSQSLLVGYVIGFALGAHKSLVAATRRWWSRHRARFEVALYAGATAVVVILATDTIVFAATGDYLLSF